ncbi:MAG TPA: hypothetical protein VF473_11395, partial [Cyclobacteriaceae bacterium]
MKHVIFILLLILSFSCSKKSGQYISSVYVKPLGDLQPTMNRTEIDSGIVRYEFVYEVETSIAQDDWHISIQPSFNATFHWQPHLTPTNNHIIAQHVFRAPAIIVADSSKQLAVLPD